MFHNGQAKTGPGRRSRAIHFVEALEQAGELVGGNANAGIRDHDRRVPAAPLDADVDLPRRRGELDRVVDEVDDNLLAPARVDWRVDLVDRRIDAQRDSMPLGLRGEAAGRLTHDGAYVGQLESKLHAPRFD